MSNPSPGNNKLQHVAIIMDGNGRWAAQRGLPRIAGHREGAKAVQRTIEQCRELGIKYLTLYAFSCENWQRPADEVQQLMELLRRFLKERRKDLHKHRIRLLTIGDINALPEKVREDLQAAMAESRDYSDGVLVLALNYGARQEIVQAARLFAEDVQAGRASPQDLDQASFQSRLDTAQVPDPDLIIRTSGEMRLSNFLLWQASYAELWFTDTLWPDFGKKELLQAVEDYYGRHRRYGK